ncbi:MAG: hypothetical protein F6K41_35455 [Symploca sp. SIO3E6]|nr:hypothetical protein [Caldora sp. SIO3E6]
MLDRGSVVGGREMGRWGDGEMGRWGDGEMGRWGDKVAKSSSQFPIPNSQFPIPNSQFSNDK